MNLWLRCDANNIIATGHVMRCLSIADAARRHGIQPVFISADYTTDSIINDRGYKNIVLNSKWDDLDGELPGMESIIRENEIRHLIVDSYQVTEGYLESLSKLTDVLYIDDLNSFKYPVDTILNYNIYAKKLNYETMYRDTNTKLMLGLKYVPLRKEFINVKEKSISDSIDRILILTGGSDQGNILSEIIDSVYRIGQYEIYAISGRFPDNHERLSEEYKYCSNVHIIKYTPNIIDYMLSADLCISAAGSTLYELCACGTPTISYILADNQINNAEGFEDIGVIKCIGDVRTEPIIDGLRLELDKYESVNYRKDKSFQMKKLVDGHGAERIIYEYYLYNNSSSVQCKKKY